MQNTSQVGAFAGHARSRLRGGHDAVTALESRNRTYMLLRMIALDDDIHVCPA